MRSCTNAAMGVFRDALCADRVRLQIDFCHRLVLRHTVTDFCDREHCLGVLMATATTTVTVTTMMRATRATAVTAAVTPMPPTMMRATRAVTALDDLPVEVL